jgi:hypothetical protein
LRKALLVVGATLAIPATAFAGATVYDLGIYGGSTHQGHGIAAKIANGEMKKMVYFANFRCADKQGQTATLSNHRTTLGAASINGNQEVNAVYKLGGGTDDVHLQMALNHGKAAGWFKEALLVSHGGHVYECVTPGGHATVAGKVFFAMKWQHR